MKKLNKGPEPGSLDWHIENYQGPVLWLRGLGSAPDQLLTHYNTRVHRFVDSELDHLRVGDFARESVEHFFWARDIGAAILNTLEAQDFPVLRLPASDPITEEVFVKQKFTMPPEDTGFVPNLPHPTHY